MQTCTFASGLIRLTQCLHIYSYITLCMNIIHLNHPPLNMHHQMCIYMLMQTEYFTEKKDLTSKKKVLIAFPILIEGLCCTVGEHEPFIINLNTATAWGPEPRRVYTDTLTTRVHITWLAERALYETLCFGERYYRTFVHVVYALEHTRIQGPSHHHRLGEYTLYAFEGTIQPKRKNL